MTQRHHKRKLMRQLLENKPDIVLESLNCTADAAWGEQSIRFATLLDD